MSLITDPCPEFVKDSTVSYNPAIKDGGQFERALSGMFSRHAEALCIIRECQSQLREVAGQHRRPFSRWLPGEHS